MKRILLPLILFTATLLFFWQFFFHGLLPIPADTIIGMYHPWRDYFADEYPNGISFKNFLITDSVRQQYPWRKLVIDSLKQGRRPFWNPYTFAGTPLLANFQSAPFYPLNILFFVLPFDLAWSVLIVLQPFLAGLFLFLYLRHFNIQYEACFLGAISFAFSGFFIAWLEWNTVLHSALWLPLILLSVEKILHWFKKPKMSNIKYQKSKIQIKNKKEIFFWSLLFVFSLVSSFLAGHLQTFFYVLLVSLIYTAVRILSLDIKQRKKALFLVTLLLCCFVAITSVQWLPTFKFINLSARELEQVNWQKEGWFIPWQHLIQFLVPDFFGNPATLNYWGVWNYGELVGYIGVLPLMMALFTMTWRKDKKTLFFGTMFFLSLFFSLPTLLAKLPYQLKIPFLSTSQPTRLLFLTDFSLAILSAFGLDWWLKKSSISQTIKLILVFLAVFVGLWVFVLLGSRWLDTQEWLTNLAIARRNLILPTGLFLISATLLLLSKVLDFLGKDHLRGGFQGRCKTLVITVFLLIVLLFDLFRFGWKFTPFTKKEYLFPKTKAIEFLQKQKGLFRIMATDRRILPPNFSMIYKLQSVDGYDPLYSLRYGELIAASERGEPDTSSPFGFNRIITPQNYESKIIDLLNVKYVLSLKDEDSSKLVKVFQEGETRVYENKNSFPRAFFVESVVRANDKQEAIEDLFERDLRKQAVVFEEIEVGKEPLRFEEKVELEEYQENMIRLKVRAVTKRLLVLTDSYFPSWKVFIDGQEDKVYQVNYYFRGVLVPKGEHELKFSLKFW